MQKITKIKLQKIITYLKKKYHCHTIILYGSQARGEGTLTSDYDIFAVRARGELLRDCRVFEKSYLDAFIYSEKLIKNLDDSFIRIKDGIVLYQKDQLGDQILNKVKKRYAKGPTKLTRSEKQVIIIWSQKMLNRATVQDIEGNYRRHWLLYDLLEAYFRLRNRWYLGPKKSFQWLKRYDPSSYALFKSALKPAAAFTAIKKCVARVIAITA